MKKENKISEELKEKIVQRLIDYNSIWMDNLDDALDSYTSLLRTGFTGYNKMSDDKLLIEFEEMISQFGDLTDEDNHDVILLRSAEADVAVHDMLSSKKKTTKRRK